jgi:hypothetical protein
MLQHSSVDLQSLRITSPKEGIPLGLPLDDISGRHVIFFAGSEAPFGQNSVVINAERTGDYRG